MAGLPSLMGASSDSLADGLCPAPHRTAIVLDWDDTLLCSTWLASQDLRLDNVHMLKQHHREELSALEAFVTRFLERATELGRVYLVTNAETGWIELSCARFLPGVQPFLSKVKVVSARSQYEDRFPNQPSQWKVQAFRAELMRFVEEDLDSTANLISIGDSHHEREALHVVTSEWENVLVKSVKFVERPDLDILRRQLDLVHSCIEYICLHTADLDLMLSHSLLMQSAPCTPPVWPPSPVNGVSGAEGVTADNNSNEVPSAAQCESSIDVVV